MLSTSTAAPDPCFHKSPPVAVATPYLAVIIGLYVLRNAWAAILLYHLGIVCFLAVSADKNFSKALRFGWNPAATAVACAVTGLSGVMLFLLWPYVRLPEVRLGEVLPDFGLGEISWIMFVVYYSTVHPLIEELFWRGDASSQNAGPSWRDAAFGGYHFLVLVLFIKVPWAIVVAVLLSGVAWGWRCAVRKYGGLGVALGSHAVADFSIVLAATLIQ